jgi:predicted Zn finger-like uncharacterized protein
VRLVDGIRTVGFRKWYRGELTRSHLSLVVLLLCGIGALVFLELAGRDAAMSDRMGNFVLLIVCAAVGAVALHRYVHVMMRAEQAAREAVCPACATYGRLDLASDTPKRQGTEVRCRSCSHVWRMSDYGDD